MPSPERADDLEADDADMRLVIGAGTETTGLASPLHGPEDPPRQIRPVPENAPGGLVAEVDLAHVAPDEDFRTHRQVRGTGG